MAFALLTLVAGVALGLTLDRGVLPLGQCTGLIDDTPTVAEVMRRIVDQAERSQASLERAFKSEAAVG